MRQLDGDRRQFFRGAIGEWFERLLADAEGKVNAERYYRPPGALPEMAFLAACTRCGECTSVCPPHAIVPLGKDVGLAAGTPHINPRAQPCTVCPDMPCVNACPTGALTPPPHGWDGYRLGKLELVAERCVTYYGTVCGVCASACPVGAKALAMDSAGHPVIKAEGCVGCGVCVRACITTPSSFVLTPLEG